MFWSITFPWKSSVQPREMWHSYLWDIVAGVVQLRIVCRVFFLRCHERKSRKSPKSTDTNNLKPRDSQDSQSLWGLMSKTDLYQHLKSQCTRSYVFLTILTSPVSCKGTGNVFIFLEKVPSLEQMKSIEWENLSCPKSAVPIWTSSPASLPISSGTSVPFQALNTSKGG